jgi:hypothetical protein
MRNWKVSSRLGLIVGIATLIMLTLGAINWIALSRLASLQALEVTMASAAGRVKHDSNHGAQAYLVVADTFINRKFDEVQKNGPKSNKKSTKHLSFPITWPIEATGKGDDAHACTEFALILAAAHAQA